MKNTKPEKKNSRKSHRYPALIPSLNLKTRHDEIVDVCEYLHLLNEDELDFLNRFIEEEVNCNLNHPGAKLNDVNDPKVRSRIYGKNNSRNRDVMSREHAQGKMGYLAEIEEQDEKEGDMESGIYEPEF